jgi:hypothetical protein
MFRMLETQIAENLKIQIFRFSDLRTFIQFIFKMLSSK